MKKVLGYILLLLLGVIMGAEFFTPYHYTEENAYYSYAPPTRLRFIDGEGQFHIRPFVYALEGSVNEYYERVYNEQTTKRYPLRLFTRGGAYKIAGLIPCNVHLFGVEKPGMIFICGADLRGRDIFSRMLYAGRLSLIIALCGVFITLVTGSLLGGLAGYFGGYPDTFIMRFADVVMMIPGFYVLLAVRSCLPAALPSLYVFILIPGIDTLAITKR